VTLLRDRKTLVFACIAAGLWAVFSLGYVFGLLGPGKGYEAVIAAMPEVVRALRDVMETRRRRNEER